MEYANTFLSMLNAMSPYLLLGFLIAGVLHAFVPSRLYSRYLAGTGLKSVATAAAIGIPLPLCSCGVLPTAVSLRRSGASRAASTSFLIATPQTGVDSIAATYSMLGLPFAILRPVAALVTSLFGGLTVGALERKGAFEPKDGCDNDTCDTQPLPKTFAAKVGETLRYGFYEMMQNIGKWLVIGLVIATLITVLVPDDFFQTYARYSLLNMLIVVAISVPMYVCATGSIPIAAALMLKGLSPGCALVLLMAGPAANVASFFVVNQAFGKRATITYIASIVAGAIGFGLLVDYWPGLRDTFMQAMPHMQHTHAMASGWFNLACSALLIALLLVALSAKYLKSYQLNKNQTNPMKQFKIKGMACNHCKASVEKGLTALPGVTDVQVDLAKGIAYVEGDFDAQSIIDKINELGFEYVE